MDIPTITWERVFEDVVATKGQVEPYEHGSKIYRAKIPGGWLVRALEINSKGTVGFVFIVDPDHRW
jgi:hypothetical protein